MSDNKSKDPKNTGNQDPNLAEEVLRQGGKSEDEVKRTGAIDRAEDVFESTLDAKFRTVNSPVHKAVWDSTVPVALFAQLGNDAEKKAYLAVVDRCVAIVARHREAGTLYKIGQRPLEQVLAEIPALHMAIHGAGMSEDAAAEGKLLDAIRQLGNELADADKKVNEQVIAELAEAGYWGMLIDPKFGGQGASILDFMQMITRMASEGDATIAGMSSIHGCIGAVDPVVGYGNDQQKAKYLPRLASGQALSAFALTEPGAGSDLTAVKTTAVLDGDSYVVNGEKLFISNVTPGRTIGLVVKIDGKHAVLIAELPETENENFSLVKYRIHAVQHIYNRGIKFTNFRIPKENLLVPPVGDGLTIAYHGLNRGRVALCANAGGVMRSLLKSMLPWAAFRETYGQPIEKRELVKRRIARIAALIVAADALRDWGSSLLDQGYRGELECIVAKIFGSDALLETSVKALKTHGGRSFLHGHVVGDNLHDLIAPSIYEGENEMLAMAFFKGLSKEVGTKYMGPLMGVMSSAGVNMKKLMKPNLGALGEAVKLLKPRALFGLVRYGVPIALWALGNELRGRVAVPAILTALVVAAGSLFFGAPLWAALAVLVAGGAVGSVVARMFSSVNSVHPRLRKHANWAVANFARLNRTLYRNMLLNGVALADAQDLMVDELSLTVQKTVTMLVTCQHATRKGDKATIAAANILCCDIRRELTGGKKDAKYRSAVRKLADMVVAGEFHQLDGTADTEILRKYAK